MDGSLSVIYDGNCSRRATVRLGIDTLIANILVHFVVAVASEWRRKTAENFNRLTAGLSSVHDRYRPQTDVRRTGDFHVR